MEKFGKRRDAKSHGGFFCLLETPKEENRERQQQQR